MSSRYSIASSANTSFVNHQRQDAFKSLTGEQAPSVMAESRPSRPGSKSRSTRANSVQLADTSSIVPDDSISIRGGIYPPMYQPPSVPQIPQQHRGPVHTIPHAPNQNLGRSSGGALVRAPSQTSKNASSRVSGTTLLSRAPSQTSSRTSNQQSDRSSGRHHRRGSDSTVRGNNQSQVSRSNSISRSSRDHEPKQHHDRTRRSSNLLGYQYVQPNIQVDNDPDYLPAPRAHRDGFQGPTRRAYDDYDGSRVSEGETITVHMNNLHLNRDHDGNERDPETPTQNHFRANPPSQAPSRSNSTNTRASSRPHNERAHPPRAFRYTAADMPLEPVDHRNPDWSSRPSDISAPSRHSSREGSRTDRSDARPPSSRAERSNSLRGPSPYQNYNNDAGYGPQLSRSSSTRSRRSDRDRERDDSEYYVGRRGDGRMQWERPRRRSSHGSNKVRTRSGSVELPRWLRWVTGGS